jgi:hypothetical protein
LQCHPWVDWTSPEAGIGGRRAPDLAGRGPRDAREAHPLRFELIPWLEVGVSGAVGGAPLVRPLLPAAGRRQRGWAVRRWWGEFREGKGRRGVAGCAQGHDLAAARRWSWRAPSRGAAATCGANARFHDEHEEAEAFSMRGTASWPVLHARRPARGCVRRRVAWPGPLPGRFGLPERGARRH